MQNKNVKNAIEREQKIPSASEKRYYPNLPYNRSKKTKFFVLIVLLVVTMGLFIGAMAIKSQWWGISFAVIILLFIGLLAPSVIKGYPTKPDVPEISIIGHEVITRNKSMRTNDIDKIVVTVLLAPVSKVPSENKAYVEELSKQFPEEPFFGTLDIYLKAGPKVKKGETIYLTIEDVLSATVDLVNAGVKHYSIYYSLKKIYEPAKYTLTKTEKKTAKLSDVSDKERRRQIM